MQHQAESDGTTVLLQGLGGVACKGDETHCGDEGCGQVLLDDHPDSGSQGDPRKGEGNGSGSGSCGEGEDGDGQGESGDETAAGAAEKRSRGDAEATSGLDQAHAGKTISSTVVHPATGSKGLMNKHVHFTTSKTLEEAAEMKMDINMLRYRLIGMRIDKWRLQKYRDPKVLDFPAMNRYCAALILKIQQALDSGSYNKLVSTRYRSLLLRVEAWADEIATYIAKSEMAEI